MMDLGWISASETVCSKEKERIGSVGVYMKTKPTSGHKGPKGGQTSFFYFPGLFVVLDYLMLVSVTR